jgi:hypothetical protein
LAAPTHCRRAGHRRRRAAAIGMPVALIIGFALTALFPLGVLRSFEPEP